MSDQGLYPIGDAARRSGLSVSAVRFYAEAGLIEPTTVTETGHRLYDIDAIARLEFVRTLRELDTGLDDIRRLIEGETTLHDLLTAHLAIVERQERTLRARRAVLRTLVKQRGTVARAALMHRLVSMSDEERERLIDDFWNDVGEGLDVPDGFVDRLRTMRPVLPEDPTATQLEAWIELAELVRDPGFRTEVRAHLRETYSDDLGRTMASEPFQEFIHSSGSRLMEEVIAVYRAGESPRSPRAQEAVTRFAEAAAALSDTPLAPHVRERMADGFLQAPGLLREIAEEEAAGEAPGYDDTYGRYLSLVAVVNGNAPEEEQDLLPVLYTWIAEALRAPLTGA
ncbi:MerR family transcriptional regulator [Marinactinospora thermotolerans]|uniref:DNA-binding transcriptional regulator, MerR family n=1 Tax=Marinactinospora thermotolerans DSM 45154 TaxID=1122192 RepID=A0A1T4NI52_9ACTN|nr:MerR family transcriptional regulator [Marinactinospora thermotolerans]SJZ78737.1 DNA-binding transcriptional regulator, MerR family [Marinactinospora thermotolerans DSM 45154]